MPRPRWALAGDVNLVLLAMKGDDEAYGELARRRQEGLRHLLRRLCRDAALADDLAQQALLRGWRAIRQLRSPEAFGAWLRRLAINVWLEQARAHSPELPLDEELRVDSATALLQQQLDLDGALARLPPPVRLCVVLAYSEGLSHAQISEHTALPLGTVKSHLTRGVARLRALLGDYQGTA